MEQRSTRLARCVSEHFADQGWQVRVAVADTVGLAWAAARFGQVLDMPLRNLTLVGSQEVEEELEEGFEAHGDIAPVPGSRPSPSLSPRGRGATAEPYTISAAVLIDQLPVAALRIDPATVELLQRLGIEQVGQLIALPRTSLLPRFGPRLLQRVDQLTGQMPEALTACSAAPPLEARFDFETSVAHAETVLAVLDRLVTEVASAARREQLGILQLVATIDCDDHHVPPLLLRLLRPTAAAAQLVELMNLHAEKLELHSPVKSLRVRVVSTGPLERRQGELFTTGAGSGDSHQLALLVNRLASRLGDDRVVRAERRASNLPERAVAYAPATSTRARSFALDAATAERLRTRPLWLRARPVPVAVEAPPPEGRPVRMIYRGTRYEVATAIGPERIETGWWHGPHHRRDYYQIETTTGNWWWVYRDLRGGRWFVA